MQQALAPSGAPGIASPESVLPPDALRSEQSSKLHIIPHSGVHSRPSKAYVAMISNEKYVDGALVLAGSLTKHSALVQTRGCDLVIMLTGISEPSRERLRDVGYRIVPVNRSLSGTNKRSAWKATLDKLYLFNLTDYDTIAFFDADMLALQNPDSIFDVQLPNKSWIAALGSGRYFATGVMVLHPSVEECNSIVTFYLETSRNKSDTRGFSGYNARDGLVFRWYIKSRHVMLPSKYSEYRPGSANLKGIVLYHFRGGWKPWYNKAWHGKEVQHLHENLRGLVDSSGTAYRLWWEEYQALHVRFWSQGFAYGVYGGKANASLATPHTHLWMDRYTPWEYVQPYTLPKS